MIWNFAIVLSLIVASTHANLSYEQCERLKPMLSELLNNGLVISQLCPNLYPWVDNVGQYYQHPEQYPWTKNPGARVPNPNLELSPIFPWSIDNPRPNELNSEPMPNWGQFGPNVGDSSSKRTNPVPTNDKCVDEEICYRIPRVFDHEEGLRFLWPGGIVYVEVSDRFSSEERNKLEEAFAEFKKYTCVEFVHRDPQKHKKYIYIEAGNPPLCDNVLSYINNRQQLCISRDCFSKLGWILNKLMRAIGFSLEITRPDRDNYVSIQWENIIPDQKKIFSVPSCANRHTSIGGYDFRSVLHPGPFASSKNDHLTIENQPQFKVDTNAIGQREKFSNGDVEKINLLYRCYAPLDERDKLKNPQLQK